MGLSDLRSLAAIETVPLSSLRGSVVAVDAHNWLYKYLTTTVKFTNQAAYTTDDGTEVPNLIGIIQGLPKFFDHSITPVFVFDGAPADLKADEIAERREERERVEAELEEARERGDAVEIAQLESRTQRLTDVILETTRGVFDRLDVPYVDAPMEGEAQAAHMARHDPAVDHAGTDDYDALLFGAPTTLRQLTSRGDPEMMNLDATLEDHDISWEQLVDIGILCGTDYNEGVSGIGPKTALKEVREHGDLFAVLEDRGITIEYADRIRDLFLHPPVTEDYHLDLEVTPDIREARAYVTDEWDVPEDEVARGFQRLSD
ncbi:MAG: flap endonuclease-1, partial [Halobacteriales archaeon]|nr:flap endonuclease-1 [Halobacteriales archaeon]